jgi:dinuclear metal center YbgI/SA1388 family protein
MAQVKDFCKFLDKEAPRNLAESWDNVGLLLGDAKAEVTQVMTCLTITPEVVAEAVKTKCNLIIAHHPLPFKGPKKITSLTIEGQMLMTLIKNDVAVYSPHTGYDSALNGINQQFADFFELDNIKPIMKKPGSDVDGSGRVGKLKAPMKASQVVEQIKRLITAEQVAVVGDLDQEIKKISVACGAAGDYLTPSIKLGVDLFITGETNFHTCLQAKAEGKVMLLLGHYQSERFAMEVMASRLSDRFSEPNIWCSQNECDPIQRV